ncbi:FimV/HubP family polar landmark protein [uncultured Thiothrix sp.]|uniref:FimV/HubP family polar landmark protein n=1 Tax=uncultured Thiothrix sp. TaxID=223185 RepID=UPI0026358A33|nr:FimV/HubP family polar landmark protein [uncultured Thiothrix sp.]
MKKQALSIAVMIAGAYPAASNALSLGDIESNSNLNQPLRAKIELLAAGAQDAKQLQVRLAPASVFNRVGIERPAFLDSLRFSTSVQNGKPVILVSSDKPITEPFVNFLLEVNWPQGQLLKEYTVMLDPPVLMQPGNTVAGNEAAVRAEPRANGTVNRPAPVAPVQPEPELVADAQEPVQAAVPQTARQVRVQQQPRRAAPNRQASQQRAAAPAQAGSRTYRVRAGDTLFKVASQLSQPGTNIDQMMMALYRANPQAFIDGNINGLKSGVSLKAPAARSAKSVSRAEARRQVRQHYVDWKKIQTNELAKSGGSEAPARERPANRPTNDNARLEVLGNKQKANGNEPVVAGAGKERLADLEKELSLARESLSSQQRENTDLKSRVDELEAMLRKKNRLITLRDEQLAELQKSMKGGKPVAGQTPTTEANLEPNTAEPKPAEPKPAEPIATQPESTTSTTPLINGQVPQPQPNPDSPTAQANGSDIQNYLGNATNNNEVVRTNPEQQQAGMQNGQTNAAMTPAERAAAAAAALNGNLNPNAQNGSNLPNGNLPDPTQPNPAQSGTALNPANPVNPAQPDPQATAPQPVQPTPAPPPTEVKPKPAEPVKPAQSPFVDAQGGNDLMSMLTSPLAWKIGAGALLSLLLLALLARFLGKRKSKPAREPEFNEAQFGLDDDIPPVHAKNNTGGVDFSDLGKELDKAEQKRPSFDELDDDPFGVNLGNTHQGSKAEPLSTAVAKNDQSEDEDEVLMEANVYIAYGLHQQAESELKKALEKHPERLEYRHKLLENYFAANNREAFDEQAQIFANSRNADRQGKLWKDVMTWGAKISPDNSLYSNGASSGLGKIAAGGAAIGAAVAGVAGLAARDVQADEQAADLSFNAPVEDKVSLKDDLAAALNALEDDELSSDSKQDDFDFNLDDFDNELNTKSNLATSSNDTGFAKAGRQNFQEAETALLADDDLDFNLDDLVGSSATEQKPASSHDLNTQDDLDLDGLSFDEPLDLDQPLTVAAKAPEPAMDDLDNMLDMDFDELTKTVDAPKVTSAADELDDGNLLDFDLDQLTMDDEPTSATGKAALAATGLAAAAATTTKAADNVTSLNLHLDKDTGIKKILPQDTFYTAPDAVPANPDDDWLGDIDEALSFLDMPEEELDLHEAHISTKLDLARAYLDMGDIEGARSTLEEVMVEGNDNQRREAETLLHQTG